MNSPGLKIVELTFVGQGTLPALTDTGLLTGEALQKAHNLSQVPSAVFDRHLTVWANDAIVETAEDNFNETREATACLQLLVKMHKAGVLRIGSLNGIACSPVP
jgi:hypothetical protein